MWCAGFHTGCQLPSPPCVWLEGRFQNVGLRTDWGDGSPCWLSELVQLLAWWLEKKIKENNDNWVKKKCKRVKLIRGINYCCIERSLMMLELPLSLYQSHGDYFRISPGYISENNETYKLFQWATQYFYATKEKKKEDGRNIYNVSLNKGVVDHRTFPSQSRRESPASTKRIFDHGNYIWLGIIWL